jgi:hypothetical protein
MLSFWLMLPLVSAQTVLYIPIDDRPVNLDYVVATAKAAGINIVTPPVSLLGSRGIDGNADDLWDWLFTKAPKADDAVLSVDSLLYGSLVSSRTHNINLPVIEDRLNRFNKLKSLNPRLKIYINSTIMRTPKSGEDNEEPPYYETCGASIFHITALRDKAETKALSSNEQSELDELLGQVPNDILADWYARREKNFLANRQLIDQTKKNVFTYFLLGRDDCSPLSQSHMESRHLAKETASLPESIYACLPGADELGILLLTRAINSSDARIPNVRIMYAPGAGPNTIPSYEDTKVGQTINAHIIAAGGIIKNTASADLVLAVNTPGNGVTYEADSTSNHPGFRISSGLFTRIIAQEISTGRPLAVADIAFANGADNTFMSELKKQNVLFKLAAYSGWNTASNTIGYTISQGMLAYKMPVADKNRLLLVRFLDDWAYQANIREKIATEVLYPLGGNWSYLNEHSPKIAAETLRQLNVFAARNLPYPINKLSVSFPWNRMFEVKIDVAD